MSIIEQIHNVSRFYKTLEVLQPHSVINLTVEDTRLFKQQTQWSDTFNWTGVDTYNGYEIRTVR